MSFYESILLTSFSICIGTFQKKEIGKISWGKRIFENNLDPEPKVTVKPEQIKKINFFPTTVTVPCPVVLAGFELWPVEKLLEWRRVELTGESAVQDLWHLAASCEERVSLHELRGQTLAIDLAGWVVQVGQAYYIAGV